MGTILFTFHNPLSPSYVKREWTKGNGKFHNACLNSETEPVFRTLLEKRERSQVWETVREVSDQHICMRKATRVQR